MTEIQTIEGVSVQVDDGDHEFISNNYELWLDKNGYVIARRKEGSNARRGGKLHRIIANPEEGKKLYVDHWDGNILNNQRSNLRICLHKDNSKNRKKVEIFANKPTTSQYKGVTWNKNRDLWEVRVSKNEGERNLYLGSFTNEHAAANCYNYYSEIHYGEYGRPNVVEFMEIEEWKSYEYQFGKTSKYRGVSVSPYGGWLAYICKNYNNIRIGVYDTEVEAAEAYNEKAIELKGSKAKLNIIVPV